jgi:prepilin-type N-terminal cleavage/methylation domain-containing protein
MKNLLNKKNNGFTLVETLVAISILSLSILSGFTAVQNSLKSSVTAKNQMIAFYLTQDAMEFIKNKRDENGLVYINTVSPSPNTWLDGIVTVANGAGSGPCGAGKTCRIDSGANTVTDCAGDGANCINLRQDKVINSATKGLYGYTGGWTDSGFRRSISIQSIVPNEEVLVTITIYWTQGIQSKSFQISQSLFNRLQ